MTRAKSMRGIQSFNQSVNRGRVAQYPEARSRTFSWILGHGYWDTHLTRVLCVSQYSPAAGTVLVSESASLILTSATVASLCVSTYIVVRQFPNPIAIDPRLRRD